MKTKLLIAALAATAVAAPAQAKLKVSGQVNQVAFLSADKLDEVTVADNNMSGSRVRFKAAKKFGDMKAGVNYELQAQDNSTGGSIADVAAGSNDKNIKETRVSEVYLAGSFGKITLGKGHSASSGSGEAYGLIGHYLGGPTMQLAAGNAVDGGLVSWKVSSAGRSNRLRYDAPSFGGLKLAVSLDNSGEADIGVRYNTKLAGGKFRLRAGNYKDNTSVSVAYKMASGLGLAAGTSDLSDSTYVGASYQVGKVVLQAMSHSDDDKSDLIIGANWKPAKGVEVYLNNVDGESGSAMMLGSRVKF